MHKRLNFMVLPLLLVHQIAIPEMQVQETEPVSSAVSQTKKVKDSMISQQTTLLLKKANHKVDDSEKQPMKKKSFLSIHQDLSMMQASLTPPKNDSSTEFGKRLKVLSGVMLCGTKYQAQA